MKTTGKRPSPLNRRRKSKAETEGRSGGKPISLGTEKGSRVNGRKRVGLPIVRSKLSGTLHLDNAKIYEFIPFP